MHICSWMFLSLIPQGRREKDGMYQSKSKFNWAFNYLMEFIKIYAKYSIFISLFNVVIINFKLQFVLCVNSNCLPFWYKSHYSSNWLTMTKIQFIAMVRFFDQQIHSKITFNCNAPSHNSIGGLRPPRFAPPQEF